MPHTVPGASKCANHGARDKETRFGEVFILTFHRDGKVEIHSKHPTITKLDSLNWLPQGLFLPFLVPLTPLYEHVRLAR